MQKTPLSKVKSLTLSVMLGLSLIPATLQAAHEHHGSARAPISIMGHHIHPEGEWMVSYSYMQMDMQGNRESTNSVALPLPGYMVSPLSMDMNMHMLGVMYGYSENVTLMAMLPVQSISMDHMVNMSGEIFTADASGVGDLKITALFQSAQNWVTSAGFNLPTGSIDERDITPMSGTEQVQLPYPMQLGSGSYELTLGTTYLTMFGKNSWGNKADITIRLNDNDRDYKLGNSIELSSWYAFSVSEKNTLTFRLKLLGWNNIKGEDAELNSVAVPTADAKLRAGSRADVLLGYNYQLNIATLIGVEAGMPVYQNLDGPQLQTDLTLQAGVQYEF
jgi:hypothetical protein